MAEYSVVITRGKIGFPEGLWMRLNYLDMANRVAQQLSDRDHVRAVVIKKDCTCGGCHIHGCARCHGQPI